MKNVHKLTEGALLLAAYTVLVLITVYLPIIGMVSNLFLAVPFILFAAKNTKLNSFVFFIAAVILSVIVGSVFALPLTLSYGLTGLVIGYFIQTGKSRSAAYLASTLVFLVTLLLQYAVAAVLFNMNIIKELMSSVRESFDMSKNMLESLGQNVDEQIWEQFDAMFQTIETLMPSLFVLTALFAVFLIEIVSLPIVKRFGVTVSRWGPFRELVLPRSILWYYLITIISSFAFKPEEGSYWYIALVNLGFILQMLMVLQGLSFIFYYSFKKGLSKAIPVIALVLTFIIPFFLSIVRILGIIDLGFDLRKRMEKS